MPLKHLKTGDALPPYKPGTIRLFSMKYCPFAQRARLVLHAKNIEYEEINCNLQQKPEFLVERNPGGQVPVFEKDGFVLYESLLVSDLLEELYPDKTPLYPKDPYEKARQKFIITRYNNEVIPAFYKSWYQINNKELFEDFLKKLEAQEEIIKSCKTPYLFGEKAGMVDYMIWPWYERLLMFPNADEILQKFPNIAKYMDQLRKDPVIQKLEGNREQQTEFYVEYRDGRIEWEKWEKIWE